MTNDNGIDPETRDGAMTIFVACIVARDSVVRPVG